jgi:hypothetical protein
LASKVNVKQNPHDGDGLRDDTQAHHLVSVFVVELAPFGEAADADHQYDKNGQRRQNDKNEQRITHLVFAPFFTVPADLALEG